MKIFSIALAAAVITAVSPATAGAVRGQVTIGVPSTNIECPGGHFVCTVKNGKRVCTCGGPISS